MESGEIRDTAERKAEKEKMERRKNTVVTETEENII